MENISNTLGMTNLNDQDDSTLIDSDKAYLNQYLFSNLEESLNLSHYIGSIENDCGLVPDTSGKVISNEEAWPVPLSDDKIEQHIISVLSSDQEKVRSQVNCAQNILIRVITWNQEARPHPSIEELRNHLIPLDRYHVIAVGTQECENSFATSLINPSKARWEEIISETVGRNYYKVCDRVLQATYLIIFAHKAIASLVSNIKSTAIPTGFGNTLGNKGGVGISFDVGLSSFCFITAHLAAHQYAVGRRTFEFQKISQEIGRNLGKYSCNHFKSSETMIGSIKGQSLSIQSFSRTSLEKQFDFVFWSGDMNYRIHSSLQEVEELLRRNCHRELYQMDQLENVKWCTPSFFGFSEGPVNFRPTYKLVTNSDLYDTTHGGRIPSWTDRILYKENSDVRLLCYCSAPQIRTSDHRPVYAGFLIKVKIPSVATLDPMRSKQPDEAGSKVCVIS